MKKILTSLTSLTILCSAAHAQDRGHQRDRPADRHTVNWDQIKQRIESAVDRGDLTREQANARYNEIKKNHAPRDAREHDQKHERPDLPRDARLKMLLGRLVESGKISREVSGQIQHLAFEDHGKDPEPRPHEHLEKLAGELERLIDRARHELGELEETREHLNGERRERGENEERRAHEQEARMKTEARRRDEMARAEEMKRHQLEMRAKAEMQAREMQQKRMREEPKKQEAAARARAENEKEEGDKGKKREKEEENDRR